MDTLTDQPVAPESPLPAAMEEVEQRIAKANDTVLTFVRARPLTCLVGAVALGFVVGKLAARF